jgi:hypothetical protein
MAACVLAHMHERSKNGLDSRSGACTNAAEEDVQNVLQPGMRWPLPLLARWARR